MGNQFLIENEASIERVDLDTIKNEFIDQKYGPSYTVDETEAQNFPWYDVAKTMHDKMFELTKHLSAIVKRERRLQQLSERVVKLDTIRNLATHEIFGNVSSATMQKTKAKIIDLESAERDFKEFANEGFPPNMFQGSMAETQQDPPMVKLMKELKDHKRNKINQESLFVGELKFNVNCDNGNDRENKQEPNEHSLMKLLGENMERALRSIKALKTVDPNIEESVRLFEKILQKKRTYEDGKKRAEQNGDNRFYRALEDKRKQILESSSKSNSKEEEARKRKFMDN